MEAVNKLWQELTLIRGNLESASWNNNKIKIQRLTEEEERVEKLYKIEQEKLQELYQQQKQSDNHAFRYTKNVFENIHELSLFHISLLNSYFFDERKNEIAPESISEPEEQNIVGNTTKIEPDMIFRIKMYEKFLILEQRLIKDNYLNTELHWTAINKYGKPDIKRLIIFLIGLLDNNYFLPNKNSQIKSFFEIRFNIIIGQNFEHKRREPLLDEYKVVFYDYPF